MEERKLILVVDDDADERELYGKLLWYNGFDVAFAEDGYEGLRVAQERAPDLVLLDMVMPGMDGLTLCARLRERPATARTPVIALTGRPENEIGRAARAAGCTDFLEKPIAPVDVLRRIEQLIGLAQKSGDTSGSDPAEEWSAYDERSTAA